MEQYPALMTKEITGLIQEKLLVEVSSPEDDLLASGVLDSLTLVQLLLDLEQRFSVTIPLEDLEIDDFRSVTSIARLVYSRSPVAHLASAAK
jgi:methoxymalonate biosynthesis acyl carrier protein